MQHYPLTGNGPDLSQITRASVERSIPMRITDLTGKGLALLSMGGLGITTLGMLQGVGLSVTSLPPVGFGIALAGLATALVAGAAGWYIGHLDNNADQKVREENQAKVDVYVADQYSQKEDGLVNYMLDHQYNHQDRPSIHPQNLAMLCMIGDEKLTRLPYGLQAAVYETQRDIAAHMHQQAGISFPKNMDTDTLREEHHDVSAEFRSQLYREQRDRLELNLGKDKEIRSLIEKNQAEQDLAETDAFVRGAVVGNVVGDGRAAAGMAALLLLASSYIVGGVSFYKNFFEPRPELKIPIPETPDLKSANPSIDEAHQFLEKGAHKKHPGL